MWAAIYVTDAAGVAVADGTEVILEASGNRPARSRLRTRHGVVTTRLETPGGQAATLIARAGSAQGQAVWPQAGGPPLPEKEGEERGAQRWPRSGPGTPWSRWGAAGEPTTTPGGFRKAGYDTVEDMLSVDLPDSGAPPAQEVEVALSAAPFDYTWEVKPVEVGYEIALTMTHAVDNEGVSLLAPTRVCIGANLRNRHRTSDPKACGLLRSRK